MTYIAQYESCGSMVRSLTTTDAIPDLYGVCGLTENSVLPPEPSETAEDRAAGESEVTGAAARSGVGAWALAVAAWWLL